MLPRRTQTEAVSAIACDPETAILLTNDADTRISDISGILLYKARAMEGTLVEDASGYDSKRVKAGVYLVFAAAREARQTCITKIAVLE